MGLRSDTEKRPRKDRWAIVLRIFLGFAASVASYFLILPLNKANSGLIIPLKTLIGVKQIDF